MIKDRFSEVEIVMLQPGRVAVYRAVSRTPEEDAVAVLTKWCEAAGLPTQLHKYGFDVNVSPEQAEAGLRSYEVWFRVPDNAQESAPVRLRRFGGGRYARLVVYDPFGDPFTLIPAGWQRLWAWRAAHLEIKTDDRQCLEEIIVRDGMSDLALYLPLA